MMMKGAAPTTRPFQLPGAVKAVLASALSRKNVTSARSPARHSCVVPNHVMRMLPPIFPPFVLPNIAPISVALVELAAVDDRRDALIVEDEHPVAQKAEFRPVRSRRSKMADPFGGELGEHP